VAQEIAAGVGRDAGVGDEVAAGVAAQCGHHATVADDHHGLAQALEDFLPVLRVDPEKTKELKYRLQTLPAVWGLAVAALGLMFAITDVPARPEAYLMNENSPTYFIAFNIFITAFNGAMMFGLIVQIMRQLWLVFQIHRLPLEINLFDLDAAHAFSKLTARAGISLILLGLLLTTEPTQSLFLISSM